jgi:hypothetical protein
MRAPKSVRRATRRTGGVAWLVVPFALLLVGWFGWSLYDAFSRAGRRRAASTAAGARP